MTVVQVNIGSAVLARARHIGHEMAADSKIRPHLENVLQFNQYHRFRNAHRAYWEQSSYFERQYQDRIFLLADKEAQRQGKSEYDSIVNWDLWYHHVVHPLKNAMWEIWEAKLHLEERYYEAMLGAGRISLKAAAEASVQAERSSRAKQVAVHFASPIAPSGMLAMLMRVFRLNRAAA